MITSILYKKFTWLLPFYNFDVTVFFIVYPVIDFFIAIVIFNTLYFNFYSESVDLHSTMTGLSHDI